jgi:hypothetical protein
MVSASRTLPATMNGLLGLCEGLELIPKIAQHNAVPEKPAAIATTRS